jgi:hypothetical protein
LRHFSKIHPLDFESSTEIFHDTERGIARVCIQRKKKIQGHETTNICEVLKTHLSQSFREERAFAKLLSHPFPKRCRQVVKVAQTANPATVREATILRAEGEASLEAKTEEVLAEDEANPKPPQSSTRDIPPEHPGEQEAEEALHAHHATPTSHPSPPTHPSHPAALYPSY